MLRSLKELYGYNILALDGEIGKVHDFYFDDEEWTVRYLVVDTGPWIFGRKVLVAPLALGRPDWIGHRFPVNLTREQVEDSPDIDTDRPVSRQQQQYLHEYFHWPMYWNLTGVPPTAPAVYPAVHDEARKAQAEAEPITQETDSHLRRAREVIGYQVEGRDERLGKVGDFILEDEGWILRYLVLDTDAWNTDAWNMQAKKVLIAPFWIQSITYEDSQVQIDLTRQIIMDSPGFDPKTTINREYEEVLYDYHGRPYYWIRR
ncbi:MAG: PRC-barrel domain-containing protein [Chloroflexota bacterium]